MWKIFLPAVSREIRDCWDFFAFLNGVAARWFQGHWRYGDPHRKQKYLSRLAGELRAYRETGNQEHLFNIAAYAYLESYRPQHPRAHLDAAVDSATRGKIAGVCKNEEGDDT